jgi:DNA-binding response OmpR family regulator
MQSYILLVDDNDDLSDNLKLILELEGFQVQAVAGGEAALQVMAEQMPALILADVVMPETNGYDFFKQVKANRAWASLPFIFLSALTTADEVKRGLKLGANAYITKPFTIAELLAVIHQFVPPVHVLE